MSTTSYGSSVLTRTPARFLAGVRARPLGGFGALALDSAMLALAAVATELGAEAAGLPAASGVWPLAFALIVLAILSLRGMYAPRLRLRLRALDDVRHVLTATTVAAMALLSAWAVAGTEPGAAEEVVRLWAFASVYVGVGRAGLYRSLRQARQAGEGLRPTLIVGAGRVGRLLAARLERSPELGLRPVGFLDKDPLEPVGDGRPLPVLGASWDLEQVVAEHGIEHVVITFSTAPDDVLLRLVRRCEELGVAVAVVPRLYEKTTTRLAIDHIGGLPLLAAQPADPHGWRFALKYALDRAVASLVLLAAAPVLAAAAVGVLLSSGRPIFFRQLRIGRDGQSFEILKFRTMRTAREGVPVDSFTLAEGSAPGGVEGEDRRTRLGAILRRTSIDELPQLLNVLKGEMSLVGPRPERPEFVDRFADTVYRYDDRHRVKSGITGWAQVHGLRGKTSIADRVEWDNYYIENFSLWLDLKIMLMTALAVVAVFKSVE